jgi:alcohol dehydrogenase (cytochrome c)
MCDAGGDHHGAERHDIARADKSEMRVMRLAACRRLSVAVLAMGAAALGAAWRGDPGPPPGEAGEEVTAWDPVGVRPAWKIVEKFPVWSGALATAGDVVFYGTMDGRLQAVGARSGKELWHYKTASGIVGQPITYRGPDGKQYVAVLSGVGGWAGAVVSGEWVAGATLGA